MGDVKGYKYIVVTYRAGNDQNIRKVYFIYIEDSIISASAEEESFYPMLDDLVKSFEYQPSRV